MCMHYALVNEKWCLNHFHQFSVVGYKNFFRMKISSKHWNFTGGKTCVQMIFILNVWLQRYFTHLNWIENDCFFFFIRFFLFLYRIRQSFHFVRPRGYSRLFSRFFFVFSVIFVDVFENISSTAIRENRIASCECVLLIQFLWNIWCEGIIFNSIVQIVLISRILPHTLLEFIFQSEM